VCKNALLRYLAIDYVVSAIMDKLRHIRHVTMVGYLLLQEAVLVLGVTMNCAFTKLGIGSSKIDARYV